MIRPLPEVGPDQWWLQCAMAFMDGRVGWENEVLTGYFYGI